MSSSLLLLDKLRYFISSNYISVSYYFILFILILLTTLSALFPYQAQNIFNKYIISFFTRPQTLKIIVSGENDYSQAPILSIINGLKQRNNKIVVKEVECEKNSSPIEMLIKGKGDLAVISSISCLLNQDKIKSISSAGEKAIYILAPRNYGFEEFQMLSGKKIGFIGDTPTGIYILERLIQFYHFDIPPELIKQRIYDIEKSFSSGVIEAIVWVEEINSLSVQEFLNKKWYRAVPIKQSVEFSKTVPGLYTKNIDTLFGSLNLICTKDILVISNRVSKSTVREIIQTWFSSEYVLSHPEYDNTLRKFTPPPFLDTHPIASAYFNKGKPLTREELKTLVVSFVLIFIAILLSRQLFRIWLERKNKHYERELEKRWEELKYLKYQWNIELSNEEILLHLKRIKSIYNWTLESYKHNFISEKAMALLCVNIIQQVLYFNERYFEHIKNKQSILELSPVHEDIFTTKEANTDTQFPQNTSKPVFDEKDKYLKTPVTQQSSKEQAQQMLLFMEENNMER